MHVRLSLAPFQRGTWGRVLSPVWQIGPRIDGLIPLSGRLLALFVELFPRYRPNILLRPSPVRGFRLIVPPFHTAPECGSISKQQQLKSSASGHVLLAPHRQREEKSDVPSRRTRDTMHLYLWSGESKLWGQDFLHT